MSASAFGGCVCPFFVVGGLTLGGTSFCGSSWVKLDDVLACPGTRDQRTGEQNSSDEHGMGTKENPIRREDGRNVANCRIKSQSQFHD